MIAGKCDLCASFVNIIRPNLKTSRIQNSPKSLSFAKNSSKSPVAQQCAEYKLYRRDFTVNFMKMFKLDVLKNTSG